MSNTAKLSSAINDLPNNIYALSDEMLRTANINAGEYVQLLGQSLSMLLENQRLIQCRLTELHRLSADIICTRINGDHEAIYREQDELRKRNIYAFTILDLVLRLTKYAPDLLIALPPEVTGRLLGHLCLNWGDSRDEHKISYLYGFFEKGVSGPRQHQARCREHCNAMQAVIADMHHKGITVAGESLMGRKYQRSITSLFPKMPGVLAKIGPDFLKKSLVENRKANFLDTDLFSSESRKSQAFFRAVRQAVQVMLAQGGDNLEQRLDDFFNPYNVGVRVVPKKRSNHTSDCILVMMPEYGGFVDMSPSYREPKPFKDFLSDVINDNTYARLYRTSIIPAMIGFVRELADKARNEAAYDANKVHSAIEIEAYMKQRLQGTNDHGIRKVFTHHYPPANIAPG